MIQDLIVPTLVENGTKSIVLDCLYNLDDPKDLIKFVLKWFFNDDPEPIYQWIPEKNSRVASRRFESRINMNFSLSVPHLFQRYRAIEIIYPTTDLTGMYSCQVQSLTDYDSKKKPLLVFGE